MRKEHLTPDGWKPCTATTNECQYKEVRLANYSAFIDSAVEDVQTGKPNAIKNFFDNLFGQVKKSSSKLESIKKVPVEIGSTHIDEFFLDDDDEDDDDKVIQGEDGQYEIACPVVALGEAVVTNKFGDFIKDKAAAETLHKADPNKHYQFGWCGVLAEELYETNEHVAGYYIFKTEKEPVIGTHHFVKLKDGTYADSLGIWTEEALFSTWKTKDPTVELSPFDPKSTDSRKKDDDIAKRAIFIAVNELINKHMNGKTL